MSVCTLEEFLVLLSFRLPTALRRTICFSSIIFCPLLTRGRSPAQGICKGNLVQLNYRMCITLVRFRHKASVEFCYIHAKITCENNNITNIPTSLGKHQGRLVKIHLDRTRKMVPGGTWTLASCLTIMWVWPSTRTLSIPPLGLVACQKNVVPHHLFKSSCQQLYIAGILKPSPSILNTRRWTDLFPPHLHEK